MLANINARKCIATYQNVQAFHGLVVFFSRSSSVTLSMPPVSTESAFAQAANRLRGAGFSIDPEIVSSANVVLNVVFFVSIVKVVELSRNDYLIVRHYEG
jgi:hypothetical protein